MFSSGRRLIYACEQEDTQAIKKLLGSWWPWPNPNFQDNDGQTLKIVCTTSCLRKFAREDCFHKKKIKCGAITKSYL